MSETYFRAFPVVLTPTDFDQRHITAEHTTKVVCPSCGNTVTITATQRLVFKGIVRRGGYVHYKRRCFVAVAALCSVVAMSLLFALVRLTPVPSGLLKTSLLIVFGVVCLAAAARAAFYWHQINRWPAFVPFEWMGAKMPKDIECVSGEVTPILYTLGIQSGAITQKHRFYVPQAEHDWERLVDALKTDGERIVPGAVVW